MSDAYMVKRNAQCEPEYHPVEEFLNAMFILGQSITSLGRGCDIKEVVVNRQTMDRIRSGLWARRFYAINPGDPDADYCYGIKVRVDD